MDINRKTAYEVLHDIEKNRAYSNLSLNRYIDKNHSDRPAFVRELVYGVLKNKILLDHYIDFYLKGKGKALGSRERTLLRMGFYQIIFMKSVPNHSGVNETVNLTKRFCKGREGFINGILRAYIRNANPLQLPDKEKSLVTYLSIKYSYNPWIINLFIREYGEVEAEKLLSAGNERADLVIRANSLRISKDDLYAELINKGFKAKNSEWIDEALKVEGERLLSDPLYKEGFFSVQDESAMMAVEALDPRPGEKIMDLCAAPGGKSLFSAERMGNRGKIISGDFHEDKLRIIDKETGRLGISIIETKVWDATKAEEKYFEWADKVIADVPCSGLGVVRRKPEIKYKDYSDEMEMLPRKQLAILQTASEYCKPGGTIVYSTCTVLARENSQVVEQFLEKNPGFEKQEERQLLPSCEGTDGFYIVKLRKRLSEKE